MVLELPRERQVFFSFESQSVISPYLCIYMKEQSLKEKTAGGLMWGGISNGVQQLLNLVFGIFLARLLSPSDYGLVGMLTIFSLIANSLQESGFMSALTRKERATSADYNAVFWFNVLCSLSVYAVLWFCAPLIAAWYGEPVLVPLGRLVFLSFVFSSFNTALRAWLFRNMRVRQMAFTNIFALFVSGVMGVTLAMNGFAYWGIAVQNLVYCCCMTLGSWYYSEWHPSFHIDLRPLRGMFGFSSRLLATNIFTHVNNNLFSIFFGRLYGDKAVGYYNQANKWTGMGHSMLTGMVWSVTQPLFARMSYDEPERIEQVFRKMLRLTAFLSMPALFGLSLVAPEFITITITEKWLPAARLMQILCVGGAFVPVATFYSNFIVSQGRSNVFMWNTVALCLAQMSLMVLLYPLGETVMVVAYTVLNTLWLAVWHYFVHRLIGLRLLDALRDIFPFVLLAGLSMILAGQAASFLSGDNVYLSFLLKVVIAAAIYLLSLRLLGAHILKECTAFLKEKFFKR